ncbi:uncharacterized protein K444DRAFT_628021 [Hyaloscypha bicolor E]|uniref:Uncharacterized protein n=1 Tax=Hyaloscypha bicolor E TaxID=1095630 RepID=A0A2J6TG45_9HELO|nr:uncharacterized protein K444DRAFT_628021 [Hyaloscypha bicolor E]PMD61993.1 hypothetical protein K444DRAFT_628021 [Hyaloscypha bicolor E]
MDTDDEPECSPPPCLTTCLQSFGNMIPPSDGDFDQVCRIISAHPTHTTFSSLYCCDLNCGRKFGVAAGHDRVGAFAETNSRFGISNIMDPGQPPASKCSSIPGTTELPTSFLLSAITSTNSQAAISTPQPASPLLAPIYAASSHLQISLSAPSPSILNSTTAPTLSPSQLSSLALSSVFPEIQSAPSHAYLQNLSFKAKVGSILGLTIFLLLLLILSILFLIRHRRRPRIPVS